MLLVDRKQKIQGRHLFWVFWWYYFACGFRQWVRATCFQNLSAGKTVSFGHERTSLFTVLTLLTHFQRAVADPLPQVAVLTDSQHSHSLTTKLCIWPVTRLEILYFHYVICLMPHGWRHNSYLIDLFSAYRKKTPPNEFSKCLTGNWYLKC